MPSLREWPVEIFVRTRIRHFESVIPRFIVGVRKCESQTKKERMLAVVADMMIDPNERFVCQEVVAVLHFPAGYSLSFR